MTSNVKERFNFNYENGASASYLVISADAAEKVQAYQVEMIANNPNPGILPLSLKQTDDAINFYYNITSKLALSQFLKRKKLRRNEFIDILSGMVKPVLDCKNYLLSHSSFVLDLNYIYIDPNSFEISMVYIPVSLYKGSDRDIKDFIVDLMMFTCVIEEKSCDNFLQRILYYTREEPFNLAGFNKLLKELRSGSCTIKKSQEDEKSYNTGSEQHIEDNSKNIPSKRKSNESPGCESTKTAYSPTRVAAVILSQVVLAMLLIAVAVSGILKTLGEDTVTTFAAVILVTGSLDVLLLRKLLDSKNKVVCPEKARKHMPVSFSNDNTLENGMRDIPERPENINTIYDSQEESILQENMFSNPDLSDGSGVLPDNSNDTVLLKNPDILYPCLKSTQKSVTEHISINKPGFIIGRIPEQVDYVLQNNAVGRVHAEIACREGLYYIKDFNSRNGTFINDVRIDSNKEYEIKNNDKIALANSEYTFIVP